MPDLVGWAATGVSCAMLDSESHGSEEGSGLQRCLLGQWDVPNQQAQAEEEQAEGDQGEAPLAPLAPKLGIAEAASAAPQHLALPIPRYSGGLPMFIWSEHWALSQSDALSQAPPRRPWPFCRCVAPICLCRSGLQFPFSGPLAPPED